MIARKGEKKNREDNGESETGVNIIATGGLTGVKSHLGSEERKHGAIGSGGENRRHQATAAISGPNLSQSSNSPREKE